VCLFLSQSELVNLDHAASILLNESTLEKTVVDEEETLPCCQKSGRSRESDSGGSKTGRFKTTVRRLYDIANVLASLGLICKVQSIESSGRKPAFKYTGPSVEVASFADEGELEVSYVVSLTFQLTTVLRWSIPAVFEVQLGFKIDRTQLAYVVFIYLSECHSDK